VRPLFQTTFGTEGNCFAACLASILELDSLDPVPWYDTSVKTQNKHLADVDAWLRPFGLGVVAINVKDKLNTKRDGSDRLPDVLAGDVYWIALVAGGAADYNHAVVMRGSTPVHDPEPGSTFTHAPDFTARIQCAVIVIARHPERCDLSA
jgi:hypothetical protein